MQHSLPICALSLTRLPGPLLALQPSSLGSRQSEEERRGIGEHAAEHCADLPTFLAQAIVIRSHQVATVSCKVEPGIRLDILTLLEH